MIHWLPSYLMVYFHVAIHSFPSHLDHIHHISSRSILKYSYHNTFSSILYQSYLSNPITFYSIFSSYNTFRPEPSQSYSWYPFMIQSQTLCCNSFSSFLSDIIHSPPIAFRILFSSCNTFCSKPSKLDSLSSVTFYSIPFHWYQLYPFLSWYKMDWNLVVFSFDDCFVGSRIVVVKYSSYCGLLFETKIICHQINNNNNREHKKSKYLSQCFIFLLLGIFVAVIFHPVSKHGIHIETE